MSQLLWRRYTEWPLVIIALIFLAAYSVQVVTNLSGGRAELIEIIVWVTWALFALDYVVNLVLAPQRSR